MDNERDELGSDLVPDYLAYVPDGGFFGWPYSYFGQHVDERVQPQRSGLVSKARMPDYALGSHTASLGLVLSKDAIWPKPFNNGVIIGQHGLWNLEPHSGYKVIFIPFRVVKPIGEPINVLTGFVSDGGEAFGRPVGVAMDKLAALLVTDNVGNTIWRVSVNAITLKYYLEGLFFMERFPAGLLIHRQIKDVWQSLNQKPP